MVDGAGRYVSFAEFIRLPLSPFLRRCYSRNGKFSNVVERWADHVKGWMDAPDTIVIRYENLNIASGKVLGEVADFVGLNLRRRIKRVTLENAHSVLPRKGEIGDWRSLFSPDDERFLIETVEKYGLESNNVLFNAPNSTVGRA